MGELDTLLYACCPKCSKPIGRSKRCDGMELNCPKCGSPLRVVVDQDAKVMVELVQRTLRGLREGYRAEKAKQKEFLLCGAPKFMDERERGFRQTCPWP